MEVDRKLCYSAKLIMVKVTPDWEITSELRGFINTRRGSIALGNPRIDDSYNCTYSCGDHGSLSVRGVVHKTTKLRYISFLRI